jgi:hypothetical protein
MLQRLPCTSHCLEVVFKKAGLMPLLVSKNPASYNLKYPFIGWPVKEISHWIYGV